jgi:HipA-like C-terminal domain/Bacterial regulatory protein, arsR family
MNSKSDPLDSNQSHLLGLLTESEPLSAQQLAAHAQMSQPTVSRTIAALGDRVVKLGAARSTRYALKKDILGLPATHDLVWNGPDADGSMPWQFGQLTYLQDDWLHVRSGAREWLVQGRLPWFLTSLQPKGYLGRALAKTQKHLPSDPNKWSLAQILHTAVTQIHDPIGAFFFGSVETSNWATPSDPAQLGEHLDLLATQTEQEQGVVVNSSAGGEQPKFTIRQRDGRSSIVKFTQRRARDAKAVITERWRALLLLEHLALQTLQSHGVASAQTLLIETETRTHLRSTRFDRTNKDHGYAMRHVVSLEAVHDEFAEGNWHSWTQTCEALARRGLLSREELLAVVRIQAFGRYIKNDDMHPGNLSFFVNDVVKPRIELAPVYDMLPMMWRPAYMSDSPVSHVSVPVTYETEYAQARQWAIEFWSQAAQLDIGRALQAASLESARRLQTNFVDA